MAEPVSLAEAREQVRLDAGDTSEDAWLSGLIIAARRSVETRTNRTIVGDAPTLVTTTGCGIDELDELLSAGPDRAALALMPILEPVAEAVEPVDPDTPDRMTAVARLIAADPAAIGAIRGAYADLLSNIVPPDRPQLQETAS